MNDRDDLNTHNTKVDFGMTIMETTHEPTSIVFSVLSADMLCNSYVKL